MLAVPVLTFGTQTKAPPATSSKATGVLVLHSYALIGPNEPTSPFPNSVESGVESGAARELTSPTGQAVTLLTPKDYVQASLGADFQTYLMDKDQVAKMENDYAQALRNFSIRSSYYASGKDSRSVRPLAMNVENEVLVRSEMAKSLKGYMLGKGLPHLLSAREETKVLGKVYEETVATIADVTTVQVKTKNNWQINSGINIFNTQAHLTYTNAIWNFSLNSTLKTLDTSFNSSYKWTKFTTNLNYNINAFLLAPGLSYAAHSRLAYNFGLNIPMREANWVDATQAVASMNYAF